MQNIKVGTYIRYQNLSLVEGKNRISLKLQVLIYRTIKFLKYISKIFLKVIPVVCKIYCTICGQHLIMYLVIYYTKKNEISKTLRYSILDCGLRCARNRQAYVFQCIDRALYYLYLLLCTVDRMIGATGFCNELY